MVADRVDVDRVDVDRTVLAYGALGVGGLLLTATLLRPGAYAVDLGAVAFDPYFAGRFGSAFLLTWAVAAALGFDLGASGRAEPAE